LVAVIFKLEPFRLFLSRSRDEQSSSSIIHRHVLDGLQEKLNDAEVALRHERDERHRENVSCDTSFTGVCINADVYTVVDFMFMSAYCDSITEGKFEISV